MKKILTLAYLASCVITLTACSKTKQVKNVSIIHEEEFGGVYIKKTIEEFNEKGFNYGDSVNIKFSNNYIIYDVPYYNGYYVDAGSTLLVAYPGYDYIKACVNYGDDLFVTCNLDESMKATITLNQAGKYKDIQEASDIHYYDERSKYTTDSEFANFREIKVGNIKDGILYRSASPCDNKHNRAHYTDTLISEAKIDFIMNLADSKAKIDSYIETYNLEEISPYFVNLYRNNDCCLAFENDTLSSEVDPIGLNMNYMSNEFRDKVAMGFKETLNANGPILIHCLEGKDRTGFVCMVIEALMGATYTEIVDDYMLTYDNYYGIDKADYRYSTIKSRNIDSMLNFLTGGEAYMISDLTNYARSYLINGGMTDSEVTSLINYLKKD
ncbi:MAG: tyrosine-protein phosphatase [bacterium]|nr:tyrosine-protein phosphatase [bacterium]